MKLFCLTAFKKLDILVATGKLCTAPTVHTKPCMVTRGNVKYIIARQIVVSYVHLIVMCDSIIQWMAFSGPGVCMSAMNVDALVKPVRILSLLTHKGKILKAESSIRL